MRLYNMPHIRGNINYCDKDMIKSYFKQSIKITLNPFSPFLGIPLHTDLPVLPCFCLYLLNCASERFIQNLDYLGIGELFGNLETSIHILICIRFLPFLFMIIIVGVLMCRQKTILFLILRVFHHLREDAFVVEISVCCLKVMEDFWSLSEFVLCLVLWLNCLIKEYLFIIEAESFPFVRPNWLLHSLVKEHLFIIEAKGFPFSGLVMNYFLAC